ncbi:hypothetical protein J2Z19_004870 [Ensifer adhaerens]|uniref:Uncharacterized protein n=1 Tax=Ensifer adhaerens TaxID=106592 RepID=A0ACC5T1X9_ENSAD|nr:DUF6636 domain-containing protein [Ensifer adhaerens]MBP1875137.1 hypothetical protein [Ensifer adhaerens]
MKLSVVGVVAFVFLSIVAQATTALAGGAPPPRLPPPDTQQPQTTPQSTPQPTAIPAAEQEEFVMPSGNIGCIFTPAGGTATYQPVDGGPELSCDIIAPRYVRATLGRSGAATINREVGDPSCCSAAPVLEYGATWSGGPYSCTSERTGLSCRRDDGHAFVLSRASISAN